MSGSFWIYFGIAGKKKLQMLLLKAREALRWEEHSVGPQHAGETHLNAKSWGRRAAQAGAVTKEAGTWPQLAAALDSSQRWGELCSVWRATHVETLTVLCAGWKGRAACAVGPTAEALATANLVGGAGSPCACDGAGGIYLVGLSPTLNAGTQFGPGWGWLQENFRRTLFLTEPQICLSCKWWT